MTFTDPRRSEDSLSGVVKTVCGGSVKWIKRLIKKKKKNVKER